MRVKLDKDVDIQDAFDILYNVVPDKDSKEALDDVLALVNSLLRETMRITRYDPDIKCNYRRK
ncbi:hypothetical protein Q5O24_04410 [Eubacteriaceae bacterium ES3]|nr:hypothetical protein [Eubacteriaceae bacterium]WKY48565.1 hypothetical protein Q5O24_04410 [Eubacteriaceae bacterium ES3]